MKVLLSEQQLQDGVRRLADEIGEYFGQWPLTIVGVMTGSLLILADLIRCLRMPLRVGIVQARSYVQGTEPGELHVQDIWLPEVHDRRVLVVDDIFDTGHTLVEIVHRLKALEPQSLHSAVLLRKKGRQRVDFEPDFVAFEIPDCFVIGYGLDYQDHFRNLPFVAVLEAEDLHLSDGT